MGQCPSSPSQLMDDEFLVSSARDLKSFQRSIASRAVAKAETSFLLVHRPDRVQKCLIEPSEVYSVLYQQAEVILDRQGKLNTESLHDLSGSSDNTRSAITPTLETLSVTTGFTSDVAPSEFTTETDVTMQMGNTASTSRRRKRHMGYNMPMVDEEASWQEDVNVFHPPSHNLGEINTETPENTNQPRPQTQNEEVERRRREVIRKYAGIITACVQPRDDVQSERERYMEVLHLRTKAQLGHYLVNRYLPLFPESPIIQALGIDDGLFTPGLVENDSDSSSSESGELRVGFGALPPSRPVASAVDDSIFMDLALTGSLGLVPRQSRSRGYSFYRDDNQKSPDHYLVLMNRRSGIPLAVCALKATDGLPVIRIYATKQRVYKQRSAATTAQVGLSWTGALPLYAWAEVVTESMYPETDHFSMYMASGSEGRFSAQPNYVATHENEYGAPVIKVVGRTDQETKYTGCAHISLEMPDNGDEDPEFHIDIANGIDPALMVCFAAIADEVMERSMRMHCKEYRQRSKLRQLM
eukprot:Nitzschia sp. Nitz4//scaffold113_size70149//50505//52085//NITZ4_005958-RA/size70149-processed-gene-0.77-mRNA-1//-1//CDS//3329533365//8361//frame0